MSLKVKVNYDGDVRCVMLDAKTFEEVVSAVRGEYPNIDAEKTENDVVPLLLKYDDDAGDLVTLTSRSFADWFVEEEEGASDNSKSRAQRTLWVKKAAKVALNSADVIGYCKEEEQAEEGELVVPHAAAGAATATTTVNLTETKGFGSSRMVKSCGGGGGRGVGGSCCGGGSGVGKKSEPLLKPFQPAGPRPLFAMLQVMSASQSVTTGTLTAMLAHFVPLHMERIGVMLSRVADRLRSSSSSSACGVGLSTSSMDLLPCVRAVTRVLARRMGGGGGGSMSSSVAPFAASSTAETIEELLRYLAAYAELPLRRRVKIGGAVAHVLERHWDAVDRKLEQMKFPFLSMATAAGASSSSPSSFLKRGQIKHWRYVCRECGTRGLDGLRFNKSSSSSSGKGTAASGDEEWNLCADCYVALGENSEERSPTTSFTCLLKPCLRMRGGCGRQSFGNSSGEESGMRGGQCRRSMWPEDVMGMKRWHRMSAGLEDQDGVCRARWMRKMARWHAMPTVGRFGNISGGGRNTLSERLDRQRMRRLMLMRFMNRLMSGC